MHRNLPCIPGLRRSHCHEGQRQAQLAGRVMSAIFSTIESKFYVLFPLGAKAVSDDHVSKYFETNQSVQAAGSWHLDPKLVSICLSCHGVSSGVLNECTACLKPIGESSEICAGNGSEYNLLTISEGHVRQIQHMPFHRLVWPITSEFEAIS